MHDTALCHPIKFSSFRGDKLHDKSRMFARNCKCNDIRTRRTFTRRVFPNFFFFFLAHDSIQTPYHGTGMKTLDRDDFKIIWAKVKCFYSKHNVEYIDDQEE